MHCGAVDHQSSYEHAISDLAQRSLIIVCKYCGESKVEKKTFFLVNYKCVGPSFGFSFSNLDFVTFVVKKL